MSLLASLFQKMPRWPDGCWPDDAQRFLLQACLLRDDDACLDAWRQWQKLVPLDFVDYGSLRLLLLLHDRLRRLDVDLPDNRRLAGVARYYWVRTESMQRQAARVVETFNNAGIETMLLKGAALNASVYRAGLRAMNDLDLVIRREDAEAAIKLLNQNGAKPVLDDVDRLIRIGHGYHFYMPDGLAVDLHWDFFHGRCLSQADQDELWNQGEPVQLGTDNSRILSPADQLLHTCEHGVRYNEVAPFRWLADACLIIRSAGKKMDWIRLAKLAERYELVLPVRDTLAWLREHLAEPIPEAVFTDLDCRRTSRANRFEHAATTRRGLAAQHPFCQTVPQTLFAWRRIGRGHSFHKFHCWQHNITEHFGFIYAHFAKVIARQTASRIRAALTIWHRTKRFATSVIPEQQIAGFDPVELDTQHAFRWSGREGTLYLPVSPGDYDVALKLGNLRQCESDFENSLQIDFNNNPPEPGDLNWNGGTVSFPVRHEMFVDHSEQRLRIRCEQSADLPQAATRHLGVPLVEIQFRPRRENKAS